MSEEFLKILARLTEPVKPIPKKRKNITTEELPEVDFDFIKELEGLKTAGYVPDVKGSMSGVTIASGFDLGQRSKADLKDLPEDLTKKLTPYLGLKSNKAMEALARMPLNITNKEAKILNKKARLETLKRLKEKFDKDSKKIRFEDLSPRQRTVLSSVAFQYGVNLDKRTPKFWEQVTNNDWDSAYDNLLNFGDRYTSRRRKEANYLKGENI